MLAVSPLANENVFIRTTTDALLRRWGDYDNSSSFVFISNS